MEKSGGRCAILKTANEKIRNPIIINLNRQRSQPIKELYGDNFRIKMFVARNEFDIKRIVLFEFRQLTKVVTIFCIPHFRN